MNGCYIHVPLNFSLNYSAVTKIARGKKSNKMFRYLCETSHKYKWELSLDTQYTNILNRTSSVFVHAE